MRQRLRSQRILVAIGALLAFQWSLEAQTPAAAKRPLTYDVVDSWRAIQGTTLTRDGQWLAYSSNESGNWEVYVRRFPDNGQSVRVSTSGAVIWRSRVPW